MLIHLFGFILLIVFAVFVYKTANEYKRNGIVWSLITLGIGIVFQLILPIFLVIIISIIMNASGYSLTEIQYSVPSTTITVVGIILSLVAGFLILRHLAKFPEENFDLPPAPPSNFNLNG